MIGRTNNLRASLWLGALAYVVSLTGTLLLAVESTRLLAVGLLIMAGVLTVIAWGQYKWPIVPLHASPTGSDQVAPSSQVRRKRVSLGTIIGAGLLVVLADLYQATH